MLIRCDPFQVYDPHDTGFVDSEVLRGIMSRMGYGELTKVCSFMLYSSCLRFCYIVGIVHQFCLFPVFPPKPVFRQKRTINMFCFLEAIRMQPKFFLNFFSHTTFMHSSQMKSFNLRVLENIFFLQNVYFLKKK